MRRILILFLALGLVLWAGVCQAKMAYFSLLGAFAVPPGPTTPILLNVEPDCCPSTVLKVTADSPVAEGDFQWVLIPLVVDRVEIRQVRVCYEVERSTPGPTYISQVRLTQMNKPNKALVMHDDGTNLQSTIPTCYRSGVSPSFVAQGTITLALKMVFGHTNDVIRIGGIRLVYR